MTTGKIISPEIIPGFDVLRWKRETQEKNLRETEGMTREQVREHIRQGAEQFRNEGKHRCAEIAVTR